MKTAKPRIHSFKGKSCKRKRKGKGKGLLWSWKRQNAGLRGVFIGIPWHNQNGEIGGGKGCVGVPLLDLLVMWWRWFHGSSVNDVSSWILSKGKMRGKDKALATFGTERSSITIDHGNQTQCHLNVTSQNRAEQRRHCSVLLSLFSWSNCVLLSIISFPQNPPRVQIRAKWQGSESVR